MGDERETDAAASKGREAAAPQKFKGVSPSFLVDDVVKSAEYYRDVLGIQFRPLLGRAALLCDFGA